jgi:CVNH domain-containing protein
MPIPSRSLTVLVLVAGIALLYLLVGGLSPAIAACPCGVDKSGNCLCCPGPPGSHCVHGPPLGTTGPVCHVDQPPRGSYQRSCDRVGWDCKTLGAWCKPRQGPERFTQLGDTGQCKGDIANMDGELHCSKGASPPNGSYADSCRDIWVQGGDLHAQCRHSNGEWTRTDLKNYPSCRNGIDNIEGSLRCK